MMEKRAIGGGRYMNILTSCKIRRDIREHLVATYPAITFQFCEDIEEAKEYLPKAEVLLTYGEDLTDELVENADQLKWIMVLSAGMDRMPFTTIEEKGIIVTNSRGIHKGPMAEYAISMLLQVSRQEKLLFEQEEAHKWDRSMKIQEISQKTLLVAGTGAIGQEVARLGKAFHMRTIGISNSGRSKEYFDEVHAASDLLSQLPKADFIVSVLPSTPDTREFYQDEHFKAMKPGAIFLNMGRGDAVRSDVLINAIQNEEIEHAVLDVFEEEPLPAAHPFWEMENVTVTPHLSGISPQYQPRAIEIFEENLKVYRDKGEGYVNLIDPRKGY